MSDDWVKDFMRRQNEKREEEKLRMKRVEWANNEAGAVFGRLRKRLQRDIGVFHVHGGDSSLAYTETSPEKVHIGKTTYPVVTLDIELRGVTIECRYTYKRDDTCSPEEKELSLRIVADANGTVQIYRNGSPYSDESEISQLLLEPVFTFIG